MKPYLQVGLPEDVVKKTLRELAPLKIHLSAPDEDRRWIELDPPEEVDFEPGLGVRVVTTGRFKFELAAIPIPAHLDRVEFRLLPKIVQSDETSQRAAIPIEILDGDLRWVPGLIDDFLVSQVNQALTPSASQLVWRFDEKLSASFKITERLQPLEAIGLRVTGSEMEVTEHEVIMRVLYDIEVKKEERSASS